MILNAHTYFSLKYGTFSPAQLVAAAKEMGLRSLALTDVNNTSCAYEFITLCKEAGIRPIVGIEFRRAHRFLFVGLAQNEEGFRQLNAWLTKYSMEEKNVPDAPPYMKDVFVVYDAELLPKPIDCLRENEYAGIRPNRVNHLFRSPLLKRLDRLVMFCPLTFRDTDDYTTHRLLRAIDMNVLLSKLDPTLMAQADEYLQSPKQLLQAYKAYPQIVRNTRHVVQHCQIEMEAGLRNNRRTFTGDKEGDFKLLTKLAMNGCRKRYGSNHEPSLERIRRELKVIFELNFCAYFLITWDIIRYAHSVGYHHVGRGSGANSIVAYCLKITDVDPLELDLYFERFINPHRTSPPDFDIDFSWDERDDVTDYIFKRYGREYTALLATYNTFKGRSIVRELGKVFGLPKDEIDTILSRSASTEEHHELAKKIYHYGKRIEGFPNYLSIHAGGVLISERPLNYYTALQLMPKGFPIVHLDMYHAEDLGFHKYDVLSQRGLGHIKDAVELVKQNQGKAVDIHDIPKLKNDKRVKEQLRSGQCIGCFYIESPAMRGLLSKLRCDNYVHLVAASSIIRPGVAQSGMMREYIQRFHFPNAFEYLHPVFEEHLGETFGVMVYQEDVMKIVHHFAGLDLDESDILRRMMTGKKRSSAAFARLRDKYFRNCKTRGHDEKLTNEVWRQIESFAGYSFCKAHSASFAVESFQSLYLKTYYPLEFMVAVINNFGGFYQTEYYFHELRMQGGVIHPPCVNRSEFLTTIYGKEVYIGLIHLHGLDHKVAKKIVGERRKNGAYKSLEDFVNRIRLKSDHLEHLIRIDAFRFTGMNKYELVWQKNAVYNPSVKHTDGFLFEDTAEAYTLPVLQEGVMDQAFDEIELLGFPLRPIFNLLKEEAKPKILAKDLLAHQGKLVEMVGYYVCKKHVTTIKQDTMYFGTWIDHEGTFFDTVHFPDMAARFPFRGKGVYYMKGRVVLDFGFPSVEVSYLRRLAFVSDERYA